ncbi:hypothetical protein J6590_025811 [Homalodisca vitripennis]|nr:hypothetical protein J6590_025811 [Homalodisca vitripennis]
MHQNHPSVRFGSSWIVFTVFSQGNYWSLPAPQSGFDDAILGGLLGERGIVGGPLGEDGLIEGLLGERGIVGGVLGEDGLIGGLLSERGIVGCVLGGDGL